MKKIIFLLMLCAIGFNMTATAQKAINSVHFYDVKNADMEKTYIASLKEINSIMAEMGFRTIAEMVGRVDRLDTRKVVHHWKAEGIDLPVHIGVAGPAKLQTLIKFVQL